MSKDYNDGDGTLSAEKDGTEVQPKPSAFDDLKPIGALPNALDDSKAKPTPMLLRCESCGLLPRGHVSLLAAPGGSGKSFLTLQLAASVATGEPWLCYRGGQDGGFELETKRPGRVLLLSAEDDWQIVNNRLTHIALDLCLDRQALRDNIEALLDVSISFADIGDNRTVSQSADYHGLCRAIRTGRFDLVIIDSLALVAPDDIEKDNGLAHRFIREYLARATRAAEKPPAVVLTHHTSKPKDNNRPDQHAIRGASGIVNGAREALLLSPMERLDGHPALVKLAHVKANLGPTLPDRYLQWVGSGPPILCTAGEDVVQRYLEAKSSKSGGGGSQGHTRQAKGGVRTVPPSDRVPV
jgi:hypothetical protein